MPRAGRNKPQQRRPQRDARHHFADNFGLPQLAEEPRSQARRRHNHRDLEKEEASVKQFSLYQEENARRRDVCPSVVFRRMEFGTDIRQPVRPRFRQGPISTVLF